MKDLAPFIIVGITSGSLYGLAGMGLVLTYKTSGVFNFAHGAVGAAAAYIFYELHTMSGLPWPLALALCVGVFAPLLGMAVERLARYLSQARPAFSILATVSLMLAIQGFLTWKFGATTRNVPQFLPNGAFRLFSVDVQYAQIVIVAGGVLAAVGLYVFFTHHRLGIAMRAVVDDPSLLGLSGINTNQVRRSAWIIGTSFAALTGILIAPSIGLDAVLLTLLVVQAFGATAVGAFSSLPLTYAGGVAVGIAAAICTKLTASQPSLVGLPASVPFIVLFAVLLAFPKRLSRAATAPRVGAVRERRQPPKALTVTLAAVGTVGLLVLPSLVGARLSTYTTALVFVVIFLSLALLVWISGQISLCHGAFCALGATTFSHLKNGLGLPWIVALLGAGLAVVPLGAILAVPAIRLSGVHLALATFGFGVLLERVVYPWGLMFGKEGIRAVPRPDFGFVTTTTDTGFYYVVLGIVAAACLVAVAINRSRLGRLLRALGDSPVALTTHGLNVNATRVIVFCVSAWLAGMGGALFAAQLGQVSNVGLGVFESLIWLTVLALAGTGLLRSSVVAAAVLVLAPSYLPESFQDYRIMIFGAAGLVVTMLAMSTGSRQSNRAEPAVGRAPLRGRLEARTPVLALATGGE